MQIGWGFFLFYFIVTVFGPIITTSFNLIIKVITTLQKQEFQSIQKLLVFCDLHTSTLEITKLWNFCLSVIFILWAQLLMVLQKSAVYLLV